MVLLAGEYEIEAVILELRKNDKNHISMKIG